MSEPGQSEGGTPPAVSAAASAGTPPVGSAARRLAVIALAILVPTLATGQQYNIRRYGAAAGLPDSRIHSILQDSLGYIWFGTGAGLARYDGVAFEVFDVGAAGNGRVAVISEDADGRIVFGLEGGGIGRIDEGRQQPWDADPAAGREVRAIHRDREGALWLALDGALVSTTGDSARELVAGDAAPPGCCTAIWRDRTQRVWVGTDSGLYRWTPAGLEPAGGGLPEGLPITTLVADRGDVLWVGTRRGLYRQVGDRFTALVAAGDAAVLAAAMGPDGVLWFGTERGALRLGAAPFLRLRSSAGLGDERVTAVAVDREGNVWFGTDGGVAKLVGSTVATYSSEHGLLDPYVVDLARGADGAVLVASRRGVVRLTADASAQVLWELDDRSSTQIRAVAAAGPLVLVGAAEGVFRGTAGDLGELVAAPPVTALEMAPGGAWVGTERGLHWLDEAGGLTAHATETAIDRSPIVDLALGVDERLWVATRDAGIWRGGSDGWERALPRDQAPLAPITALGATADGSLWIATSGGGVLRLLPDGTTSGLTRADNGLSSDHVQQVLPTAGRGIWIYTNRGLDRWDPVRGIQHFDLGDGLPSMSGTPGAAIQGLDGRLWFGSPAGLVEIVDAPAPTAPSPPVAVIREFTAGGVPADEVQRRALTADRNDVSIAFSALTYRDEASTRFQVRLLGPVAGGWSQPTTDRRVSFVDLAPGDYTFEVQAINESGLWSDSPASVSFTVRPRPWQTGWFRGLVAVAGLLLVGQVFRRRLRQVDDDRRRLRRMVDKRTRELVEKNALLERMATTDELTGLPNRRFFLDSLERELRKLTRLPDDQELSLLVIDLDRFKSVNDRFGHAAGDEVLRQVARRLAQGVRATDLPARYGGEEFAILLPGTGPDGSHFLAEKLRGEVEGMRPTFDATAVDVTISVGVATISGVARYDEGIAEDLLRRADEAMYAAKEGGRNRVVAADPSAADA